MKYILLMFICTNALALNKYEIYRLPRTQDDRPTHSYKRDVKRNHHPSWGNAEGIDYEVIAINIDAIELQKKTDHNARINRFKNIDSVTDLNGLKLTLRYLIKHFRLDEIKLK